MLAIITAATVAGESAQYAASIDAVVDSAINKVRSEQPDAAWAFHEWDDCQHGRGSFTDGQRPLYFTQDQCDASVVNQAARRGSVNLVKSALKRQTLAIVSAQSSVAPAWPLSLFLRTEN